MVRRRAPASEVSPTVLITSTGNTHGIRFKISPPSSASPSSRHRAGAAAGAGTAPGVAVSCSALSAPPASRTVNTPVSAAVGLKAAPGFSVRRMPSGDVSAGGLAASSVSGVSAANHASVTPVRPGTNSVPSGAMRAWNGEGRGACWSAVANRPAWGEANGTPCGRSSRKSPDSGTQTLAQISHSACSCTGTAPAAPERVTGSSKSPV